MLLLNYGIMKMTEDGTMFNQRNIVLVPFPHTDLSAVEQRPVLIISKKDYNSKNEDIICCALTSNLNGINKGVKVTNKYMESGHLNFDSIIAPCKVWTPNKNKIIKTIGRLNIEKSKEVVKFLNLNIKIEE